METADPCDAWFTPLWDGWRPWLRLCCFPSAGGSASAFGMWSGALPAWVELRALQLPGRANRLREQPVSSMAALLPMLRQAIEPLTDLPLVLLGHSNGALVAYELARSLRRDGAADLRYLVLSSKPAPHLQSKTVRRHQLGDDELIAELGRFGGTPIEVLEQRDFMRQMLPTIRADFALAETHQFLASDPLDVPAALWWGRDDRMVAPSEVQAWQQYLRQPAGMRDFSGGHFYLQQNHTEVLRGLVDVLGACGPTAAQPQSHVSNRSRP